MSEFAANLHVLGIAFAAITKSIFEVLKMAAFAYALSGAIAFFMWLANAFLAA